MQGQLKRNVPVNPQRDESISVSCLLDRRLVNKSASSQVLLLGYSKTSQGASRFSFELPRRHAVNDKGPEQGVPFLMGLELVRQNGLAVSHLSLDVPMDSRFLLRSISFSWENVIPTYPRFAPLRGIAEVMINDVQQGCGHNTSCLTSIGPDEIHACLTKNVRMR